MVKDMFKYYLSKNSNITGIDEITHDLIKLCFDEYPHVRLDFIKLLLDSYLDYSLYWSYKYGYKPNLNITAIGLDAEWNPCTAPELNNESQMALFQVATYKNIFLFDLLNLPSNKVGMIYCWKAFARIMNKSRILKIGFDFEKDMSKLRSYVAKSCKIKLDFSPKNFLDLRIFKDSFKVSLLPFHPDHNKNSSSNGVILLKSNKTRKEKGLSELVFWCFGKYLDKSEQLSRWVNRPLRRSQIMYSALDAFCLLEIHEFLMQFYFIHELECVNINCSFPPLEKWYYAYPTYFKDIPKAMMTRR
ncbi:exonuclease mut-7 homolog isoform X2 [Gordionus sp. m RMFG-2023]|uniref:exonuclease mut-7 homolog isoform X2 n=1 Tax=Gordionus sp. m RMFG-2023 TaxID=3053472 RepID=UPI0031FC8A50